MMIIIILIFMIMIMIMKLNYIYLYFCMKMRGTENLYNFLCLPGMVPYCHKYFNQHKVRNKFTTVSCGSEYSDVRPSCAGDIL